VTINNLKSNTFPTDIQEYSLDQLSHLAKQIRSFLIKSVSKTGGHIGANLGVIELTIALHHCFDLSKDQLVFDTGHQGYTHKILTGRSEDFKTLNAQDGMSRFLSRNESKADLIDASHAGTAISIATGIATQISNDSQTNTAIAFVGDGCLVEGMSAEGLNFAVSGQLPLIIVINDNGMSIPVNVGGVKNLFSGPDWANKSQAYFSGLGYNYISVEDGHNLQELVPAMGLAKDLVRQAPTVIHVKTEKGYGLEIAKTHPYKMHFSMPFDPVTGDGVAATPSGTTYAVVAGNRLHKLLKEGHDFTILTPSTPYASGLDECLVDFPSNTIDVGMAEQHALGMATGLALKGKTVFVCYQSTFMQRALDMIIHDICFMNLSVTILAVRSGFAGMDSHTHHGIYDISFLRGIPNLKIFYPGSSYDLEEIINQRVKNPDGPMVVLHPYEQIREDENVYINRSKGIDDLEVLFEGDDGYIFSVGNTLESSIKVREKLLDNNLKFGLINIRWLKPLPTDHLLKIMRSVGRVITTEENVYNGGFGASIAELISDNGMSTSLIRSAIDDVFVKPGDKETLSKETMIDPESIFNKIRSEWSELF